MKIFLTFIVLLLSNCSIGNLLASTNRAIQDNQVLGTCEELVIELARFKDVSTVWGITRDGDPWRSTRHSSAAGESFVDGVTIYKSKSRFNKSVRQITEDIETTVGRTLLLDEKGRQIGQRLVKETRVKGNVTGVLIWRITYRKIQGISAPSLKLALTVEKANITCRSDSRRP